MNKPWNLIRITKGSSAKISINARGKEALICPEKATERANIVL
jgi:hypothetical protein